MTLKEINEKEIIQIEVKKGNALYYIRKYGRSTKGCYMRIGSSCKSMTEEQIENLYSSYILLPEKQMNDISVLRNDFTFVKFKNYLTAKGIHYNEFNFLNNFSLVTSEGKFNLLGELLADENKISIKVAVFKGNDIVPIDTIRANVMQSGLRDGSVIYGDILQTSIREVSLLDAIETAQDMAERSTVPGTSVQPISAADVQVDKNTGIVTVTVIEDFSTVEMENSTK